MSRYLGPKIKIIKKYGLLPNLESEKLKSIEEPKLKTISKFGSYKLRLQETQKLKFNYGLSEKQLFNICLLYTSPSPRDGATSRMPSSA